VKLIKMEAYYVIPPEPVEMIEIPGIGAIPETPIPASR
jgi:hypothetical protein